MMKPLHYCSYQKQRGISLIEILISLLVASIMLIAITNMYGGFISSSKMQKEQSNAQDQANFAFLTLNRAIRMAGAGLCVRPTIDAKTYLHQKTNFNDLPPLLTNNGLTKLSGQSYMRSFYNPSASDLGTSLTPAANSDALLVVYSDSHTRRINAVLGASGNALSPQEASPYNDRRLATARSSASDPIFYYNSTGLQPTWIMISDCEHTAVLKYTNSNFSGKDANVLPLPEGGSFLYNFSGNGQNTLISRLYAKLFFVAKNSDGISQLYVKDLLAPNNNAQPIAAYVDRMQIEYKNPTNNTWVSTNARTNWGEDWPVRITLTMNAGRLLGEQTYSRILNIRN